MKNLGYIAIIAWVLYGIFWVVVFWPEKEVPWLWEDWAYKNDNINQPYLEAARVIFDGDLKWRMSCDGGQLKIIK